MASTHLILGSNSTDKRRCLSRAVCLLKDRVGKITASSSIYESEAWGYESQHSYLNQVVILQTELSPELLLSTTQEIEKDLGRKSKTVNGIYEDRPIDIDILFYNSKIVNSPVLHIPHPRLYERRFVLEPLLEIDAEYQHPVFQKSIYQLYQECPDKSIATRLEELY